MAKTIDYYLTLISPWTYLGSARFEEMARRHGAEIRVKPVNYGVIFPRTGGLPLPKRAPERQAYRLMELKRWPAYLDIPLNTHPKHFPVPDGDAACMVIAAENSGGDPLRLAHAILRAVWVEDKDITDMATLAEIAQANGHDGERLTAAAQEPETRAAYEAQTEAAIARGVFGAPTYIYQDELFWGQDRLDFLDRALAA
ncbi:MAG: 2-hydroxychromene-2-carboxylate isomerase [Proteobacteria bacterium]|nr:2-hydroxychromene-2-carboxylate isomerase [Pseudomonadota bacterium]MCH8998694.1 2-hydroxychromene-2-carboxylate isomerase [Pseudomonadota bacterium]